MMRSLGQILLTNLKRKRLTDREKQKLERIRFIEDTKKRFVKLINKNKTDISTGLDVCDENLFHWIGEIYEASREQFDTGRNIKDYGLWEEFVTFFKNENCSVKIYFTGRNSCVFAYTISIEPDYKELDL